MEGPDSNAVNEAARVFYRKIALRAILAHSSVAQELERANAKLRQVEKAGVRFCCKCGVAKEEGSMLRMREGCQCDDYASGVSVWCCAKCFQGRTPVPFCRVCPSTHRVCATHGVSVGCDIVEHCDGTMLPHCEKNVKKCSVCSKRMCRWHTSGDGVGMCEKCGSVVREYEAAQRSTMRENAKRHARRLLNKRTTKKTKTGETTK
jgi:hypothetical protein